MMNRKIQCVIASIIMMCGLCVNSLGSCGFLKSVDLGAFADDCQRFSDNVTFLLEADVAGSDAGEAFQASLEAQLAVVNTGAGLYLLGALIGQDECPVEVKMVIEEFQGAVFKVKTLLDLIEQEKNTRTDFFKNSYCRSLYSGDDVEECKRALEEVNAFFDKYIPLFLERASVSEEEEDVIGIESVTFSHQGVNELFGVPNNTAAE